jgi:hypothetical protein
MKDKERNWKGMIERKWSGNEARRRSRMR